MINYHRLTCTKNRANARQLKVTNIGKQNTYELVHNLHTDSYDFWGSVFQAHGSLYIVYSSYYDRINNGILTNGVTSQIKKASEEENSVSNTKLKSYSTCASVM
jgi:hypothetical protein